jgi:predicted lipid-binding transport protein (Tim44 family)
MATAAARTQPRPSRAPRTQPRPRPRPETRVRRPPARPRLAGSVAWIGLVAVLLAGIVALNVGLLRLNMEGERLDGEKQKLVATRDGLTAQLSRAAAAGRIEAIATGKLGLVRADERTYIRLGRAQR